VSHQNHVLFTRVNEHKTRRAKGGRGTPRRPRSRARILTSSHGSLRSRHTRVGPSARRSPRNTRSRAGIGNRGEGGNAGAWRLWRRRRHHTCAPTRPMARPPLGNAKTHSVSSRLGSRIGAIALPAAWLGAGAPTALPPPSAPRGLAQHAVPSQVALERAASAPLSSHLHSTRALAIDQCRCARAASVPEALCVHRRGCPNSSPPQRKRVIVKALGERSAQTTQLVEHGRRR